MKSECLVACCHPRAKPISVMSKIQYYQRREFNDAINDQKNSNDKNFEKFCRLLVDRLLSQIGDVPFRWIINDHLQEYPYFRDTLVINSRLWSYKADVKLIEGWITYSFRFPNACHPKLYNTFDVEDNNLFKLSRRRHRSDVWYKYRGKKLLEFIGNYLDIASIVEDGETPHTMLFVNQEEEKIDIYLYFMSNGIKITIAFENWPSLPEV